MNLSTFSLPNRITPALIVGLFMLTLVPRLAAQFNPIGFEGSTINNIPYATNVGIPNGTPVNTPFSYTFLDGNNLQSFNNASAGIVDSDDGSGGSNSVPDYYKSPQFGWKLDGWQTTNNTTANWNVFNNSYVGNGASAGTDYPGGIAGRTAELGEALNLNQKFSPAQGNLPSAPGLGEHFLDAWGSVGNTSQISLQFLTAQTDTFFITTAFGGRDSGSDNAKAYYRLIDSNNNVVFSGDTSATPYEAWTPINPSNPSAGSTAATKTNNVGVKQADWEYFKTTFNVTAGSLYTLQVLLPEEINFDLAIGSTYSYTPGIVTDFSAVPEPSTYGMAGVAVACGLIWLKRRKRRTLQPSSPPPSRAS